ncbi:MAG: hypothetical protein HRU19_14670 [Pseudobacteriovorax sp.]|nr:hypothetical protein [Pseudobacteriovorax sp.]
MKRIFEYTPTEHDILVSRTLVMVHQAIDTDLPSARPASQRFAKTAFGEEPTLTKPAPSDRGISGKEISGALNSQHDQESYGLASEEKNFPNQMLPKNIWRIGFLVAIALFFFIFFVFLAFT